ncbi:hypothetical protein G9A89_021760 [Geosiphon pyriformis]|nr:hypothetical protein G9A89_021760 [Geosiphon pyriformis]
MSTVNQELTNEAQLDKSNEANDSGGTGTSNSSPPRPAQQNDIEEQQKSKTQRPPSLVMADSPTHRDPRDFSRKGKSPSTAVTRSASIMGSRATKQQVHQNSITSQHPKSPKTTRNEGKTFVLPNFFSSITGNNPGSKRNAQPPSNKENNHSVEDSEDNEDGYEISISSKDLSVEEYNVHLVHELFRFQNISKEDRKKIILLEKDRKMQIKKMEEKTQECDFLLQERDAMAGRFEQERRGMQKLRDEKDLNIQHLEREVRRLKEESSHYQSALGNATNVRWGDDDSNNSVQLKRSIEELQQMLANFTTLKGKKYGIKINEVEGGKLLAHYNCRTQITHKNAKKILSAALQRLTLETLFRDIESYFKSKATKQKEENASGSNNGKQINENNKNADGNDETINESKPKVSEPYDHIEYDIVTTTRRLSTLIELLREHRQGNDDLTRITPVKIRQQVYAVLGARAFCKKSKETQQPTPSSTDNPNNDDLVQTPPLFDELSRTHFFIHSLVKKCMNIMTNHRDIKYDAKMNQQYRDEAVTMVQEVVHLYMRLQAQEPIPEFREFFASGEPVRGTVMSGPEIADENSGELEVEICSFPLISSHGNRVLCKAQVETRLVQNNRVLWKRT